VNLDIPFFRGSDSWFIYSLNPCFLTSSTSHKAVPHQAPPAPGSSSNIHLAYRFADNISLTKCFERQSKSIVMNFDVYKKLRIGVTRILVEKAWKER